MPALIYLIFNLRGPSAHGWGVPMATDIAFALGALNLIAPQAPIGAKVLLTALAIVDDMGAVLIISLFYSEAIVWGALCGAAVTLLVLIGFNLIGIRRLWPYLLLGVRPMVFCSCLWRPRHDRRRCPSLHHSYTFAHQRAGILQRSTLAAGSIRSYGNRRPCGFDQQRATGSGVCA